ncbi:MAG TPA: hypothetical protein VFB62_10075, partial [Polyangiaceae bacterium]|nr:hypothetical protein [Polyangiaceae bacterium]
MAVTLEELLIKIGAKSDEVKEAEKRVLALRQEAERLKGGAKSVELLRMEMKQLKDEAQDTQARVAEVDQRFDQFKSTVTTVVGTITAVAAAITVAAKATFDFVNSNTAALDAIGEFSATVGIGVEELQRLQFAAQQSGVGQEKLGQALKFLNKNMLDLRSGGAEQMRQGLDMLGLGLSDLEGKSRTQQIGLISDRLKGIADAADRSAIAARIFGEEAGPALASLLNEGSEGIEKLAASAEGIFTQEQIDAASNF